MGHQLPVSAPRTLERILADAIEHEKTNPTHGVTCACMDNLIREVRRMLPVVDWPADGASASEWERRSKMRGRIRLIMETAVRNW